jgi:hypothetical protein
MLNRKQVIILVIGIALMILSELFPPWKHIDGDTSAVCLAGYHYYKNKPELKTNEEILRCFPYYQKQPRSFPYTYHISTSKSYLRLYAQRMLLSWLMLSLMIAFHKARTLFGWLVIFLFCGLLVVGATFLLLWIRN